MRSRPPKPLKRVNGLLKTNSRCHRAIHGVQALPKRLSAAARARSYADADLEHDGGADDRRARRRSDEPQYPRFAERRNWNTDPHPPRPPYRLPPAPRARILRSPNCNVNLEPALGLSTSRLRTPASAGHPSQSSTGRDRAVSSSRTLRSPDLPCDVCCDVRI